MQLQRGEKRSLSDLGVAGNCEVKVEFGLAGIDIAAFGLEPGQKIGDDRYVVLFSNPATPGGEVRMTTSGNTASFALELDRLPASIDRIVFTATHDSRAVGESRPLMLLDRKAAADIANTNNNTNAPGAGANSGLLLMSGGPMRAKNSSQLVRPAGLSAAAVDLTGAGIINLEAHKAERPSKMRLAVGDEEVRLAFRDDPEIKGLGVML